MKRSWFGMRALVPLLLVGTLAQVLPAEAGFLSPYQEGRRAIDQKNWRQAIAHLQEAVAENEEVGELVRIYGVSFEPYLPHFYMGLAYYELGEFRKALWEWELAEQKQAVLESPQSRVLARLRKDAELKVLDTSLAEDPVRLPNTSTRIDVPTMGREPGTEIWPAISPPGLGLGLRESHALLVGVSQYGDRSAWPSLPGVREDIEVVDLALRKQGFRVRVVRDPTKRELIEAMEDFFYTAAAGEASRMLFYYAGHGATLKTDGIARGYLVPADAPNPLMNPHGFRRASVSMARFQEYADEAPARHLVFLFDSCFSGSVFDVVRSVGVPASIREKVKEKSRMFIAAGDADQEVPDKSYFRRAFVEALEGAADLNGDGMVFGVELGQFIAERVPNQFYQTETPQTPRWGRSGDYAKGDFPFSLGPATRP